MWAKLLCGLVVYRLFKRLFYGDDALDFETTDCGLVVYRLFKRLFYGDDALDFETTDCGLVVCRLFKRLFYGDDALDFETTDCDVKFAVGSRLEKLYGGKVYHGLRIPDPDTGTRQNIDMVLVTKREAAVINVKNISGFTGIDSDGSWICSGDNRRSIQRHPDPVMETRRQVAILESYLEQRGVPLPDGYLSCKVVLPNPASSSIHSIDFPPEVVSFDQWVKLRPEPKSMFSGWIKDAFRGWKKEMKESIHQQLQFVLLTAPKWDRLELKENKHLLGEFLDFKGNPEDIQALRNIKRSKVSRLIIQKSSILGIVYSTPQVLYCDRDYRNEGASYSDWKALSVRSKTEILFQPQNSSRVGKFKLSSITSLSLSA